MATQSNTTAPAFTNILGITTLPEAPILASTGSFTISDVDMPNDSVSVDIPNVSIEGLSSTNAVALAAALNTNAPNFLTLSVEPNTTFSAETPVNWSFNIANIPAFESLLNGDDIKFSYQIDATDSNDLVTTQTLDFTIQGKTQILDVKSISGVLEDSVNAIAPQRATVIVQTENGTQIRLFDTAAGFDVTDKFNLRYNAATDLNSGIKTLTFELKDGIGYNGTKSLTAKSFLDSATDFTSAQSTFSVPIFIIPSSNGDDTITGSAGADTLSGGLGNDTYVINDAANVILEGVNEGSSDTVHSTISYALPDNVEELYLDGTAATGTGNSGSNKIFGNGVNNTLDDGDAVGSTITNTLSGGKGGDTYIIHSSATMVTGETNIGGVDAVRSFVNFILPKNVEDLTLMGTLDTSGKGNNLSNTIIGNSGNNTLDGGAGADTLEGGTGDDLYIIDRATDVIHESTTSGTDTIQSIVTYALPTNVENLTLVGLATISGTGNADANIIVGNGAANTLNGGAGNDVLRGEKGNDVLIGDAGNDTLIGGVGVDTLTGGDGADTFMFESLTEMGTATRRDVITDFQTSVDKIDLLRLTSETLTSKGTSAFDAINQIRWSFYGAGTTASPYYAVVQGNLSGDLLPEFEIKLNSVTSFSDLNMITPDTTAPVFLTASANQKTVVIQFTEADTLAAVTAAASAFSVTVGGVVNPVTAVAVDAATKSVILTLTNSVTALPKGQQLSDVIVTYTDPTTGNDANAIQDSLGNDVASMAFKIKYSSVYSNTYAFAALRTDGSVVTWGGSPDGGNSSTVEAAINGTIDVTQIYSTGFAFAALRTDGSVITWGDSSWGGNSSTVEAAINGTIDVTQIYSTSSAFAALRTDGSVITWGSSSDGGDSTAIKNQLFDVVQIYSCAAQLYGAFAALRKDGSVVTWGSSSNGGNSAAVENQLNGTIDVIQISSNKGAFAALRMDGSVITWGDSTKGGDNTSVETKMALNGTIDVIQVYSNDSAFAALRADGSVITWGDSVRGGDNTSVETKTALNGIIDVVQIYSDGRAFTALRADGSVITWGDSVRGGDSSAVSSQLVDLVGVSLI